ncbi:hypothetical protein ACP179_01010 (plasmid) [Xenorhabdus stockiae]|uniref:hypothetical protein n=1 Tax=Xenorhabdus stockiae TaxID=351614 RepID=UPI003CEC0B4F
MPIASGLVGSQAVKETGKNLMSEAAKEMQLNTPFYMSQMIGRSVDKIFTITMGSEIIREFGSLLPSFWGWRLEDAYPIYGISAAIGTPQTPLDIKGDGQYKVFEIFSGTFNGLPGHISLKSTLHVFEARNFKTDQSISVFLDNKEYIFKHHIFMAFSIIDSQKHEWYERIERAGYNKETLDIKITITAPK